MLQNILDEFTFECLGEPAWPISQPLEGDSWLSGRLDILAQAGLTQPAWKNNRQVWLLTPTGPTTRRGDPCYGRMLLRQASQEARADH
ncbi:hypothetical protein ABK905_19545 [Acerihabitans sp. KWT182]|uniref:Winged helix DNA-binding domain-containing protein n=1 Tax=Acerihabitans sp. KWT182 TaxID=3157919 RepID=A0AAU7Q977_9GAMM